MTDKPVLDNRKGPKKFVAGASGNPAGRPPMPAEIRQALIKGGPEAVATILDLMSTGETGAIRLRAAEIVLDRILGKAVQPLLTEHSERSELIVRLIALSQTEERSTDVDGSDEQTPALP